MGKFDRKFGEPLAGAQAPAAGRLRVVRASDIKLRATRWLWEDEAGGWLPLGGLSLLGGREGSGKSTVTAWLAARVTRGTSPGDLFGVPRQVIVAATEDAWEQTIAPRLVAADADMARVLRVDVAECEECGLRGLMLPTDIGAVTALCLTEDVALIVLDPLMGTIETKLNSHKDQDVRQALEPLARLAHDAQVTVLGLIHQNKGAGTDLLTRLMGSVAFAAVARSVLVTLRERAETNAAMEGDDLITGATGPELPASYLLGQEKNNLAARIDCSVRYAIETQKVGYDAELAKPVLSSRLVPYGTVLERVSQVLERHEREDKRPPAAKDKAAEFLKHYLAQGKAVPSAQVKKDAERNGHSSATVSRAAKDIGVFQRWHPDGTTTWEYRTAESPRKGDHGE